MRESPNVFAVIVLPVIVGGVIIAFGSVLSLPVVHKSVKNDGACVRVLSLDGMANCENMPKKYVTEWVE